MKQKRVGNLPWRNGGATVAVKRRRRCTKWPCTKWRCNTNGGDAAAVAGGAWCSDGGCAAGRETRELHRARNGAAGNGGAAPPEATQRRWLKGVVATKREDRCCCREMTRGRRREREFTNLSPK